MKSPLKLDEEEDSSESQQQDLDKCANCYDALRSCSGNKSFHNELNVYGGISVTVEDALSDLLGFPEKLHYLSSAQPLDESKPVLCASCATLLENVYSIFADFVDQSRSPSFVYRLCKCHKIYKRLSDHKEVIKTEEIEESLSDQDAATDAPACTIVDSDDAGLDDHDPGSGHDGSYDADSLPTNCLAQTDEGVLSPEESEPEEQEATTTSIGHDVGGGRSSESLDDNKWERILRKSKKCREVGPGKWLYMEKYPFENLANGNGYACTVVPNCGTFAGYAGIMDHLRKVHALRGGRKLVEVAPSKFLYLNKYYIDKTEEESFVCSICSFSGQSIYKTIAHVKSVHMLNQPARRLPSTDQEDPGKGNMDKTPKVEDAKELGLRMSRKEISSAKSTPQGHADALNDHYQQRNYPNEAHNVSHFPDASSESEDEPEKEVLIKWAVGFPDDDGDDESSSEVSSESDCPPPPPRRQTRTKNPATKVTATATAATKRKRMATKGTNTIDNQSGRGKSAKLKTYKKSREISPGKWLYAEKYSFENDGNGFRCTVVPNCTETLAAYSNIADHMRKVHDSKRRKHQGRILVEVAPAKLLYRNEYYILKKDDQFVCAICGFTRETVYKTMGHIKKVHIRKKKKTSADNDNPQSSREGDTTGGSPADVVEQVKTGIDHIDEIDIGNVPEWQGRYRSYDFKEVSPNEWLYEDEYPFTKVETGYKCGFPRCQKIREHLHSMGKHFRQAHINSKTGRGRHAFEEIEPGRFLYAKEFRVDLVDGRFHCLSCGQKNKDKYRMYQHLRLRHINNIDKLVCDQCGKFYTRMDVFRAHLRTHEPTTLDTANVNVCNVCGKTFGRKASLSKHLKIHREEGRFECELCDKNRTRRAFGSLKKLQSHQSKVHRIEVSSTCSRDSASVGSSGAHPLDFSTPVETVLQEYMAGAFPGFRS